MKLDFKGRYISFEILFLSGRASIPGKFIIGGSDERESVYKEKLKINPVHTDSELFTEKQS